MSNEKKKENTVPVLDNTAVGAIDENSQFLMQLPSVPGTGGDITLEEILKRPFTRLNYTNPGADDDYVYYMKLFKGFAIQYDTSDEMCQLINYGDYIHRDVESSIEITTLEQLDLFILFFNA